MSWPRTEPTGNEYYPPLACTECLVPIGKANTVTKARVTLCQECVADFTGEIAQGLKQQPQRVL